MKSNREFRIICKYDPPRPVHPDVCKWHRDEKDPICEKCNQHNFPVNIFKLKEQQEMITGENYRDYI